MGLVKDSALKRAKELHSKMVTLNAQIRLMEKELDQIQILYTANQQVLSDFAAEEAIEKAKIKEE